MRPLALFGATASCFVAFHLPAQSPFGDGWKEPSHKPASAVPLLGIAGVALPGLAELRVSRAAPAALVAAVLGFAEAAVPLPGGAVLGIDPLVVPLFAAADGTGRADLAWQFPAAAAAGLGFLATALALDSGLPFGAVGSVRVATVLPLQVPVVGAPADLVVVFGQSNAEGFAALGDLPLDLLGPQPRLRIYNDWVAAWQPLQAGRNNQLFPDVARFGPELGMVVAMAERAAPLWLVKCAVAQSSLGPAPGPWNEWGPAAGELYPELLRRIDAAAQAARNSGLVPQVRLVCMMQGESDALSPALGAAYGANLVALVQQLRADLAARQLDRMGPAAVRIGLIAPGLPSAVFVAREAVRAGQQSAADVLLQCEVVETAGLELQPDQVHFAGAGLLGLGQRWLAGVPF